MGEPQLVPILVVPDLEVAVPFDAALGFEVTYRQQRPNPYTALRRGPLDLHLAGVPGLVPGSNTGSVLLAVDDSLPLHREWSDGLRAAYGAVPTAGFPRMTRPRVRAGAGAGFSVVDPGGNWVRVVVRGSEEAQRTAPRSTGLVRVVETAARQGDARGDVRQAVSVLEAGLLRHADAPAAQRLPALEYLAELLAQEGDTVRRARVEAEVEALRAPSARQ